MLALEARVAPFLEKRQPPPVRLTRLSLYPEVWLLHQIKEAPETELAEKGQAEALPARAPQPAKATQPRRRRPRRRRRGGRGRGRGEKKPGGEGKRFWGWGHRAEALTPSPKPPPPIPYGGREWPVGRTLGARPNRPRWKAFRRGAPACAPQIA
jgi:hypothetical protein